VLLKIRSPVFGKKGKKGKEGKERGKKGTAWS